MLKYLLAVLAMCSVAAAGDATLFFGESEVVGERFVLESLNGEKFSSPREVFIEFPARGRIAGRICNVFQGPCVVEKYVLTADVASSRMLCPDAKLREFEHKFFQFMKYGIGFVRAGDVLEFRRDDVSAVFRLAGKAGEAGPHRDAPAVSGSASVVKEGDLEGRKFVLAKAEGEDFRIMMGQQPFVQFDKGMRMFGRACNNFNGPGSLEDGKLFMRNAASTMMMCVDETLSKYEGDFYKLLQDGADVRLEGGELTLSGNGRTFLYREEK